MPRLFIAAELNQEALGLAAELEADLRTALRRRVRVRWTRSEGRHVTMAFLGQVDDERVGPAGDVMSQVAARHQPTSVVVGGLGAFPSARRARVLWIGVEDPSGELPRLADDLQVTLRAASFDVDEREFKGHLTLGRVADRRGVELLDTIEEERAGSVTVPLDSMVLFESHLSPSGARYRPLRRVSLGSS